MRVLARFRCAGVMRGREPFGILSMGGRFLNGTILFTSFLILPIIFYFVITYKHIIAYIY